MEEEIVEEIVPVEKDRSERAALKAYPPKDHAIWHSHFGTIEFDANFDKREGFIKGHKQAQQELALTWQDVKEIKRLCDTIIDDEVDFINRPWITEQEQYELVVRRFNEMKER